MFFLKTHEEFLLLIFELMSSCLTFRISYWTFNISYYLFFDFIEPSIFDIGYCTIMEDFRITYWTSVTPRNSIEWWLNWWFTFHLSQLQAIWCFILRNYLLLWREYEILGSWLSWVCLMAWYDDYHPLNASLYSSVVLMNYCSFVSYKRF